MSSQRGTGNQDSCRDLNGTRLSTVKEAKKLAAYIETEEDRKKALAEERKQKLEKLERSIQARTEDVEGDGSSIGKKRRLEDTEYVEKSKEIVEGVRNAVTAGLLKKRKKAKKVDPVLETLADGDRRVAETVLESSATAPLVAAVSVAAATIG